MVVPCLRSGVISRLVGLHRKPFSLPSSRGSPGRDTQQRLVKPWAGRRWRIMAKKEVVKVFKIMAPGGKATPAPPLGPALGGAGVNPGQFCQQFNAATAKLNGKVVGCVITSYSDRSFTFEIKSSPA